jgi:hypothetical protein
MSITSAKTGATGISLALDNNFMEPIASVLVGSGGSAAIIFNDIPQTYKHLQIRTIGMFKFTSDPGGSGGAQVFFNSDTSLSYTRHELGGTGTAPVAPYGVADYGFGAIQRMPFILTDDHKFGVAVTDILDYTNTNKFKTTRSIGGFDKNSASSPTGDVYINSFQWRSTQPITSITMRDQNNPWAQYTRVSLYGIKG